MIIIKNNKFFILINNLIIKKGNKRKELVLFISLFILIICNIILTSCENINNQSSPNNETVQNNTNEDKISIPDSPTEAEIDTLMKESFFFFAAYGYNNVCMAAFDGDTKIYNGNLYTLAIEEIRDYKAWAERIRSTFTEDLAEVYLNNIGIVNIDGTTYVFGGGAGGYYEFELYTYEIKSAEKGYAILELTIPIWYKSEEPHKSKVEMTYTDGKWKISYEEYSLAWR